MSDSSRPSPRRPVSRERYVARRIGAGAVSVVLLLVLGFGLVKGVGALGGGPREPVAEGSAPATTSADTATPGSTVDAATSETGTTPPGDGASTAPATVPPTVPASVPTTPPSVASPPTATDPARILVVGDSDAGAFGPYLKELLDTTGVAQTTVDYKVSSGLARPDFFNWPAHLAAELPEVDPDIVVVTFGGNDSQGLAELDGSFLNGDPIAAEDEWVPEYARRAGEVMDLLAADGRTVVWVGIPNDNSPEVTARLAVQNEAVHAALATHPDVQFVDTWARFSSPNGGWAEYVVDPRDGQGKKVRAEDGFHLNQAGAEILALDIAELVKSDLRTRGATI